MHQILLWIALALIAAGVVALNVWDYRRRRAMSPIERKIHDAKVLDVLREGW